ncbi:hypothetical protein C7U89_01455 [Bradyrhizobium sp. WBOS4]|nr:MULTISPECIES: hypothetical protein [unclassified Bradyrhizobium]MDD1532710.1 hypothetical protein [Bradyrhizobium sp. WBOS8]MDD1581622.1 hypothetical protein [Bradyrhizobium sp. WBOS4]UUO49893.1 hypothetical protein DCM78_25080 [Bradyrhizobium sp. WBOS04]UUO58660.1 hypothetical protein DCM80_05360 [Bradyrhizobium sp. WBOS08]
MKLSLVMAIAVPLVSTWLPLASPAHAGPERPALALAERFGWIRTSGYAYRTFELTAAEREAAMKALMSTGRYDYLIAADASSGMSGPVAQLLSRRSDMVALADSVKFTGSKSGVEAAGRSASEAAAGLTIKPWSPTRLESMGLESAVTKPSERSITINLNGKTKVELAKIDTPLGKVKIEGEANVYVVGGAVVGLFCISNEDCKEAIVEAADETFGIKKMREVADVGSKFDGGSKPLPTSAMPPVNVP